MVKSVLIAGLGGFIGTALRFIVSRYVQVSFFSEFPWGTFIVNIAGSFLIGIIMGISERGDIMSSEWRLFLAVGICGGFTTFSSLSNESFILLQSRDWLRFVLYPGLSFFLGLIAVYAGRLTVKLI
jgi:fluoride exporter